MRELVIALILLANLIIQSSVFPFLRISSVGPDTLLALVVSFALQGGNPAGVLVGFFGGLIQDLIFGGNIGLGALQYMVVGYLIGAWYGILYVDKIFVPILTLIIASVLKQGIMFGYNFFIQSGIPLNQALTQIVLPEAIYTLILMPLIYSYISSLYRHKFMQKKWHFKEKQQ